MKLLLPFVLLLSVQSSKAATYTYSAFTNGTPQYQLTSGTDMFGTTWVAMVGSSVVTWMIQPTSFDINPVWHGPGPLVQVEISAVLQTVGGDTPLAPFPGRYWRVFNNPYTPTTEGQTIKFTMPVGGAMTGDSITALANFASPTGSSDVRFDITYTIDEVPEPAFWPLFPAIALGALLRTRFTGLHR